MEGKRLWSDENEKDSFDLYNFGDEVVDGLLDDIRRLQSRVIRLEETLQIHAEYENRAAMEEDVMRFGGREDYGK